MGIVDTVAVPPCISSARSDGSAGRSHSVTAGASGAACMIQAAYRGGVARREASLRRLERRKKDKEANDRAREKVGLVGREGGDGEFFVIL